MLYSGWQSTNHNVRPLLVCIYCVSVARRLYELTPADGFRLIVNKLYRDVYVKGMTIIIAHILFYYYESILLVYLFYGFLRLPEYVFCYYL